ncbi:MAG: FtsX-like permease family protein [Myxococcota bacterium]|nr:FtsX-like permease family protein [Myxococcota bacterium]
MPPLFRIAAGNLLRQRRRTLLLGGAIACVTALLVMVLGLTSGLRRTVFESATILTSGHVNVGGFFKVSPGHSTALITDFPKVAEFVRSEVPELDYLTFRERGWARLVSDTASIQLTIVGVDIRQEPRLREVLKVYQGSEEGLAERHGMLLFRTQAEKLGIQVGDRITVSTLTARGVNNTIDTRVVALAEDVGAASAMGVFLPSSSLRELYSYEKSATGVMQLYLKESGDAKEVQGRLRKRLAAAGYQILADDREEYYIKAERVKREAWVGQKLDVTTWEYEIWIVGQLLSAMDALVAVLTFILLAIISVGVMNSLWVAVRERQQEIGTLRAIGMHRRWVVGMFVVEATLLGLASTFTGGALGWAVCAGLNSLKVPVPDSVRLFVMSESFQFAVESQHVAWGIALIAGCTVAVSLLPSFLAARLKPITAMHSIG